MLAGCGLEAAPVTSQRVTVTVTEDAGHQVLTGATEPSPRAGETVLDLLARAGVVRTDRAGAVVAIDGTRGPWRYWVNGSASTVTPGRSQLSPGDTVQFDRGTEGAPATDAVVGAFPEPFAHGEMGRHMPARLECDSFSSRACGEVRDRLARAGAIASAATLGAPAGPNTVRVVVGKWSAIGQLQAAEAIAAGPARSGVYARPDTRASSWTLLDGSGRPAGRAPHGSGLVAAVAIPGEALVWIVTGFDAAAVDRAAADLDEAALRNALAVLASQRRPVKLPVSGRAVTYPG